MATGDVFVGVDGRSYVITGYQPGGDDEKSNPRGIDRKEEVMLEDIAAKTIADIICLVTLLVPIRLLFTKKQFMSAVEKFCKLLWGGKD